MEIKCALLRIIIFWYYNNLNAKVNDVNFHRLECLATATHNFK